MAEYLTPQFWERGKNDDWFSGTPYFSSGYQKKTSFLPVFWAIFLVDFSENHIWRPVCGILETFYQDFSFIEGIRSKKSKLAKLQALKVGRMPKIARKRAP